MERGLDLKSWWGPREWPQVHWKGSAQGAGCPPGMSPRSREEQWKRYLWSGVGRSEFGFWKCYLFAVWPVLVRAVFCFVLFLKYHKLDGLNNKHIFIQLWRLGNGRSKHQQIWCLVRASFLACNGHLLTVCPPMGVGVEGSYWVSKSKERINFQVSSCKGTDAIMMTLPLWSHLNLIGLQESLIS